MPYKIEPQPLTTFIKNSIRLPRFQRKKTWTPKQKFELCISIFKQYPIGVVIVNRENNNLWLLDGRQRRETISEIIKNPCNVYDWAKKFIGFKQSDEERKIADLFWVRVEDYLQRDKNYSSSENNNQNNNDEETNDDFSENDLPTFNSDKQQKGLDTLLRLILLCHNKGKQAFPDFFKFATYFVNNRAKTKENFFKLDNLLRFLIEKFKLENDEDEVTEKLFLEKYIEEANISEQEEDACKTNIHQHWQSIKESIDVLSQLDLILNDARIGVIELVNATPLDAQNIFSLVNKGGTKLKAEELLSAKPFWNEPVHDCNNETKEAVKQLYNKLAINSPGDVCRWDMVATIISRLENKGSSLFFKKFGKNENDKKPGKNEDDDLKVEEVTIGFKIVSALYEGGISAKHVAKLEKKTSNLQAQNEDLSKKIDDIIETLYDIEFSLFNSGFFKSLLKWKQNIMELTSVSIALEYVTILQKLWADLSCSTKNKNNNIHKKFRRCAFILLDRLIYEYIAGKWKGSSDSKLANDLKDYKQRCDSPIEEKDWLDLLTKLCKGEVDLKNVILYYDCSIRNRVPQPVLKFTWDIDHIIPKVKCDITNNSEKRINGLGNRTLLHKSENISKHDKYPSEIDDPCIIDSLVNYAGLSEDQLKKYKSPEDLDILINDRIAHFENVFLKKRNDILNDI